MYLPQILSYIGLELDFFIKTKFQKKYGCPIYLRQGIPYAFIDYLELIDWTGRVIRDDKRGAISAQTPSLLSALGLDSKTWLELSCCFGKNYHGAVGSLEELALFAEHTGKQWISGKTKLQQMLH